MNLTAIIEKSDDGWYVGQIEEFPAAISQGKTINELKANLIDAFNLLLKTNKEITRQEFADKKVIREDLLFV